MAYHSGVIIAFDIKQVPTPPDNRGCNHDTYFILPDTIHLTLDSITFLKVMLALDKRSFDRLTIINIHSIFGLSWNVIHIKYSY
jgi:hypothetical protein